ncbi:MAG TPA: CdaR family protein [Vicinamibacterales bacterium]|nr:CdaR family protein [Vicinamibacterales bacterium]
MAYHPFRNPGLKIMSVLLASALWFIVAGEQNVERTLRVPLEFRNTPVHLEILGDPPTTIDIRVRGSSALLSRIDAGEVVAMIDLAGARQGSRLFHLRTDEVRVPYGVDVLQLTPATIALELEQSARRALRIQPAIEGEPAPGFVTGTVTSDPASVEVVGPESHIKGLTSATTETVSIAGRRENFSDTVTVGVSDAAVRLVEPKSATVSVEIVPAPVERVVGHVPIRWRNLNDGLTARVQPQTASVTVRGRRDALEAMRAESIDAFVNLAGLGPGQYNLRVEFDPTESFGVSATEPAVVKVTIK